jgi:hypothetical protein
MWTATAVVTLVLGMTLTSCGETAQGSVVNRTFLPATSVSYKRDSWSIDCLYKGTVYQISVTKKEYDDTVLYEPCNPVRSSSWHRGR